MPVVYQSHLVAQFVGNELGPASAKIIEGRERQGSQERSDPTSKARGERLQAAVQEALERGKNTTQKRSFSIM